MKFLLGSKAGKPLTQSKSILCVLFLLGYCISGAQVITTFAGTTNGYGGDGGLAINALMYSPQGVVTDLNGNIYISDTFNNRIRKVDTSGVITTIAGTGVNGYSGDGGPATNAMIGPVQMITVDPAGNVYFCDVNCVRKINTAGIISTIAGTGILGFSGDGGPAIQAQMSAMGIAIDATGNIFVSDGLNARIRKIDTAGIISTFAGTGVNAFSGDGGPAISAELTCEGLTFDHAGNLYFTDLSNLRIRKINQSGIVSTVAGYGVPGYSGDGGPATSARMDYPRYITTDAEGNLYVSDVNNYAIRKVSTAGIITTFVGTGTAGFSGDGGPAVLADINEPAGMAVDQGCNLYLADPVNHRIRKVKFGTPPNVSISASNTLSCSGSLVTLSASGAVSYSWSTGSTSPAISISPTVTNIYTVTAINSQSCMAKALKTISVVPLPAITATTNPASLCSGQVATLMASGAASYTWMPGDLAAQAITITPISGQSFTLTGTGAYGCKNRVILPTVAPTPSLQSTPVFYVCNGPARLVVSGAQSYTWQPGNLTGSLITPEPSTTTVYTVTGSSASCTNLAFSTVSVGIAPPFIFKADKQAICQGDCFSLTNVSPGFSQFSYNWGDTIQVQPADSKHCYTLAGQYTVTANAQYSTGCIAASTNTLLLTVHPVPFVNMTVDGGAIQNTDIPVVFHNLSANGANFSWDFGDSSMVYKNTQAESATHTYTATGKYCAKLTVKDTAFGCSDTAETCLVLNCKSKVHTPNVFTPNGDGINDLFTLKSKCVSALKCSIYNRWQQLVCEWSALDGAWDGRNLQGELSDSEVYFYFFEYIDEQGESVKKAGTLMLLR